MGNVPWWAWLIASVWWVMVLLAFRRRRTAAAPAPRSLGRLREGSYL